MVNKNPVTAPPDTFGIIDTKPLDSSYLDSLFSGDPEEIEPLSEPDTGSEPTQSTIVSPKKQDNPEPELSSSFLDKDTDFIEGLDGASSEGKTADASKDEQGPSKSTQAPPPGEKETQAPTPTTLQEHVSAFAKELFDVGVLVADQDEEPSILTPEELIERFNHEKKKGAIQFLDNILSHFGQEYRDAFNAIYINGVHPADYFRQLESVTSLADLDLARVENQKLVLSRHYRDLGWDSNKIAAKIEKLENYQDLEEEARDIHAAMLVKEKQAIVQAEEDRKQELGRKAALQREHEAGIQQILQAKLKTQDFDGIPVDDKLIQQIGIYMLEKKWQLADEQISDFDKDILDLSRPENRERQVKVALLLQLLKTDPSLSRLQKKAVTKETNKIFSFLQREQRTQKRDAPNAPQKFFED